MTNLFTYLVQVSLVFSLLYLLYVLLLEKLTFHSVNRFFLLSLLPISLLIPVSGFILPSALQKTIEIPLYTYVKAQTIENHIDLIDPPMAAASYGSPFILTGIYLLVLGAFMFRIIHTHRKIFLLKEKSILQKNKDCNIFIGDVSTVFSYFNNIFIPKNNELNLSKDIIVHEKSHIRLHHSWDILLSEIYLSIFWFNPLLYFYRKSLKSVHEFQADREVLENGIKTSHYMQLLLDSLDLMKPNNLYNYFSQPIIKKRVLMMTKPKSLYYESLKYFLILPVCIVLISAFTLPSRNKQQTLGLSPLSIIVIPPSLFPVQNGSLSDVSAHFGEKLKQAKTNDIIEHHGLDIRAKTGTPVVSTASGIVNKASMQGNWGNLIIISHADGYETWYAHLHGFNVKQGQEVQKGNIIGYVGSTGRSNASHLHYEVKLNGIHLNPIDYLE
ncbi:peptidoglycan DD-metalloendopeptidase family protein [Lutimonas sp.]|uniref:peptidoglycan DD-metalloendopeptidase family protein n=1 Tax=Lutimonas sp. TaxID=1872403 RepID=UPI003D9AEF26